MSALERLYSPPEIGAPGKRAARSRRRDLLLAGLFVLTAALLALGTLALLSPGLFGGALRLRAYFADARGLERGMLVEQDGYVIGAVEAVTAVFPGRDADAAECPPTAHERGHDQANCPPVDSPGPAPGTGPGQAPGRPCFRATLRLQADWPVPTDSRVQLGSAGLLTGDVVLLTPGAAPARLTSGAVIRTDGRETDLVARLNTLSDTVQRVVDQTIAPALENLRAQIAAVGDLLGGGPAPADGVTLPATTGGPPPGAGAGDGTVATNNRERLAGAFASLQRVGEELEQAIDGEQIAGILAAVRAASDNLAGLSTSLNTRTEELGAALARYDALAADLRRVVNNAEPGVQTSVDSAQYIVQELAASLAPIMANLETATRELAALGRELRAHPNAVIRGRQQQEQAPWFNR